MGGFILALLYTRFILSSMEFQKIGIRKGQERCSLSAYTDDGIIKKVIHIQNIQIVDLIGFIKKVSI